MIAFDVDIIIVRSGWILNTDFLNKEQHITLLEYLGETFNARVAIYEKWNSIYIEFRNGEDCTTKKISNVYLKIIRERIDKVVGNRMFN